ncbi:MAG: diphosphomevalonate decarboxylase [Bacteroidia bacterium]|nr:diphosphomevalonate decarboxylase [Bacteroidia bacterium]
MIQSTWKCPSNIALIKYWGKQGKQLPANPSLSFTLSNCFTKTQIGLLPKKSNDLYEFSFFFEGNRKKEFEPKLSSFFEKINYLFPFINEYSLEIKSENSFPHSSGIASSASAFGALALCLCSIEKQLDNTINDNEFFIKTSTAARLGSGSACRSVYAPMAIWGKTKIIENSSDEYAVKFENIHPIFQNYCDTILIADDNAKEVSSSVGHSLLNSNPFSKIRFNEANKNLKFLIQALKKGDLELFNNITESEALMLHALMMTSNPYFILMKPNTLNIINEVWNFRKLSKLNLTITLDAGANVHLLFPDFEKTKVREFINNELSKYCIKNYFINDFVGNGPEKLNNFI